MCRATVRHRLIPRSSRRARQAYLIRLTAATRLRPRRKVRKSHLFSIPCWAIEAAMNHFDYRDGVLPAEAVNLSPLAETVGTPFYSYSTATPDRHYRVFADAFAGEKTLVCYAMKANSNQSVLRTLAKLRVGAAHGSGAESE